MSHVTLNDQAEPEEMQLAPRMFAPWAFGAKGRGKGGAGGRQLDVHGGRYVAGGYMAPDGSQWECRAQYGWL